MPTTTCPGAVAILLALGGGGAWAQTAIPPSPPDFVLASAQSDQYEMSAAQLAEVEGKDPRVHAYAHRMIEDHTRLRGDLLRAATAANLPSPPPAMSSEQAKLLSGLQGLRGADFDKAYANQQELAHVEAVAVTESFATGGADATLKKAAGATLPTLQEHLTMARQLRSELGGS